VDDVQVTSDVPAAFARIVREARPRTIALSGGETARRCYEHLAGFADLEWSRMQVLIGDERWVGVDHPDSNEGMARRALLDRVGATNVHSARGAGATLKDAASAYHAVVEQFLPIDVVHLGRGEDGHTASLFPGSPALAETERLVVTTGDDGHPHQRLTLTYPALARSRLVVFTVEGEEKRTAFGRVRSGDDVPAGRVRAERVVWLVTPEVAGLRAGRG